MSKAQHTPTPFRLHTPDGVAILADGAIVALCRFGKDQRALDTRELTREEANANAAFIVHAANSHADLLDNLKNLCNVFGFGLDPVKNECQFRAVERARAVIKLAEGLS